MLTITFLPNLKQHLFVIKLFACLPLEWDGVSGSITLNKSRVRETIMKCEMLVQLTHAILQVVMTNFSPYSDGAKLQSVAITGIFVTGIFVRWNWPIDRSPSELINCMLHFERTLLKGELHSKNSKNCGCL